MISVKVDPANQRIDLKVDQQTDEADMQRILAEIKAGVLQMRTGWLMVNDLRGQSLVNPKLDTYIAEVQKAVMAASPRKIATLVDSQILKLQLGIGAVAVGSASITQRFDNEPAWLAFIAAP